MSLTGATVFIAIATTLLAVGAIITAVFAGLALRKQSRELKTMEDQFTDQRGQLELQQKQFEQQTEERRRAQACCVFIWTEPRTSPLSQAQRAAMGTALRESAAAHVKNSSQQPIYDLTISWRRGTAPWGEPDHIPVLLPDKQEDRTRAYPEDLPPSVDLSLFGAVARFRDAAAVHWLLRPDGHLEEDPPGQ
jgi:hypothetical protein